MDLHHHRNMKVLRWARAGLICLVLQLLLIRELTSLWTGFWPTMAAYAMAYIVSGNVNFAINSLTTWRHRHPTMQGIGKRWLKFVVVNIISGLGNAVILWCFRALFTTVYDTLDPSSNWYVTAAFVITPVILADGVSAVGNFLLYEKVVFRHDDPPTELVERNE